MKPGAVPSVFSWSKEKSLNAKQREERLMKRSMEKNKEPDFDRDIQVLEVVVENTVDMPEVPKDQEEELNHIESSSQTPSWSRISVADLRSNPKMLRYYTGLEHSAHFDYVLNTLGPAAHHLQYRWRKPTKPAVEDQFLMTLMKLRLHKSNIELSFLFDISEYSVANIFVTWINFMYIRWRQINIFPSRELVKFYMPESFRQDFANTRLIIDGMEVPIQKPSKPAAQQITYSTYKNRNTLKTIIGITPGGLTSYIPDTHGGSASDRLLVERSNLTRICDPGDSIMCDKGFDVQDIFAPFDVAINVPTFMRKKNQLSNNEVLKDRKIASKRVHVERVIGLAKTYKILVSPMNDVETVLGSHIVFCCFMLCNMRPCIVPNN